MTAERAKRDWSATSLDGLRQALQGMHETGESASAEFWRAFTSAQAAGWPERRSGPLIKADGDGRLTRICVCGCVSCDGECAHCLQHGNGCHLMDSCGFELGMAFCGMADREYGTGDAAIGPRLKFDLVAVEAGKDGHA